MIKSGSHCKLQVAETHRDRVRAFHTGILAGKPIAAPHPDFELFEMQDGFVVGVFFVPDSAAPAEKDFLDGTWLEIMTEDPEELITRLRAFGVKEIDYWDKAHFYFHSPGGPVFRVANEAERYSEINP
jgi:hypothetical protein